MGRVHRLHGWSSGTKGRPLGWSRRYAPPVYPVGNSDEERVNMTRGAADFTWRSLPSTDSFVCQREPWRQRQQRLTRRPFRRGGPDADPGVRRAEMEIVSLNTRPDDDSSSSSLAELAAEIVACRLCPRLVVWRERVAVEKVARFAGDTYWGRPLPGFGDPDARVFVLGLAPAAHGGNRTGRIFTGDRSGDFLCSALYATGFASQPTSVRANDGLILTDAYLAAAVRCAPPMNRPTIDERDNCFPYLARELGALAWARVIVALGAFAWDAALRALVAGDVTSVVRPRPKFGHGAEAVVGRYHLIGSFHPSQRNTFTGRLRPSMLEAILRRAGELARI